MNELRYDFGADTKNIPLNSGKTVYFTRFTPLAVVTTALSEGTNPTETAQTASTISATIAEYGAVTQVGSLYATTSIETGLKEHVEVHGQNAGESIDQLIRTELNSGATGLTVSTATALLSDIHTTDVLTGVEVRRVVRTLKGNKAIKFEGGLFRAVIGQWAAYDLLGNSEWLDANRYTTSDAIKRGVIGKLHGVEFVETNNPLIDLSAGFSTSATNVANVHHSFFFGQHAYACINLGSISAPKIYVKNPGENSTDNPLNMFSTVGWKMPFAAKVLNANWVINLKHGATGSYNAA